MSKIVVSEKPRFKPFQLDSGEWQVFWVFPDGSKDPVDDKTYPSRQNAYRRAKQLNDGNVPPRFVYVQITTQRQYCVPLRIKLREMVYKPLVIDPLGDGDFLNQRYILFSLLCRLHEDNRASTIPGQEAYYYETNYDGQPPTEQEFRDWLKTVAQEPGMEEMQISYHSF